MIRQAILVFDHVSQASRLMELRVASLSLLERGIRTLARAGIEHILVVVPEGADLGLSRLTRRLGITIEFLTRKTAPSLSFDPTEGFLLLLGDYVHHQTSLTHLLERGLAGCDLIAQVSECPPSSTSLRAVSIASDAVDFAPPDTPGASVSSGAFLCAADLFSPIELAGSATDVWTFLQKRAAGRKIAAHENAPPLWHRVEDRRSVRAAKNMLFSQVTKPTSGFISRHLNARISIPTSKLLIETGISPHMVTVLLVLTTGLAGAYLVAYADNYFELALAGILWQFAAIFDRCDGEIARIKLCESKFGAWFDTVTDNLAYICAYIGMLIGVHRLHPDTQLYLYLGLSAIVALLLSLAIMYTYAWKTGTGSLQNYLVGFARHVPDSEKGFIYRFMQRYAFIAKRDFFSFFIFVLALLNAIEVVYWFVVIGLHLVAVGVLISQHKMLQGHRILQQGGHPATLPALDSTPASSPSIEDHR